MIHIFILLRIKHWVKNFFIFIPAYFAGTLFFPGEAISLLQGFIIFSFMSSAVYVLNDIRDIDSDRNHPKKKFRPLASGQVKKELAIILLVSLLLLSSLWAYYLNTTFFFILQLYLIINISYSFGLKNIPILDLFLVSSGFLLRVLSGGIISGVPISNWLLIMVSLLSLFLVLAKRRDDLVIHKLQGTALRKSTHKYNLEFINACLTMLSAIIVVAYIMYTVSDEVTQRFRSSYLFLTFLFVIAGLMRYLQIAIVEEDSGSPTNIFFKDKFILITVLGWAAIYFFLLYI